MSHVKGLDEDDEELSEPPTPNDNQSEKVPDIELNKSVEASPKNKDNDTNTDTKRSNSGSVVVTPPSVITDSPPKGKDVVKKLESGGRILSLIRKAETKRVAKRKIIQFLKKKGVSESKIIEAYSNYYHQEGLYEITFNQRPLGFSVIMDTRGKNAIVSSVQDENNDKLGMKVASRIYEINGKRVDDLKHKDILKLMAAAPCPFYVVFKEVCCCFLRLYVYIYGMCARILTNI